MPEITSLQNEKVKYVVKLREDRRTRTRDRVMLVEGKYELDTAISSGLRPKEVFYCEDLSKIDIPKSGLTRLTSVSVDVFMKMSYRENPDGWMAIFPAPNNKLSEIKLSGNPMIILVESVEKPGNLGAILRTADSVGVDGLIVCDPRLDLYNPNVIRASRGTIFNVPLISSTNQETLNYLKMNTVKVFAASPEANTLYTDVDYKIPICIALGTEHEGLTDFWMENADTIIKIPMKGKVNSLNVSTSAAILLYEVLRQRNAGN